MGVNPYMASSSSYPTLEAERTTLGEKGTLLWLSFKMVSSLKGCPRFMGGSIGNSLPQWSGNGIMCTSCSVIENILSVHCGGSALLSLFLYLATMLSGEAVTNSNVVWKVLLSNQAPVAQEFLKRGSPRCLRGRLWAQVLGSAVKQTVSLALRLW